MDHAEFRQQAHRLVDWMADYFETIESRPVVPDVKPGEIRAQLPGAPPAAGEAFDAIFEDFERVIVPGMTHWQHPNWFAYFPANSSPPSVLAEMLTSTLAAQCMSWQTSPAATELEQVVMDWLRQMLGFPAAFTGVIQDTASTATLTALLSARERITEGEFGQHGRSDAPLVVYASEEAHASVDKGVKLAGYGLENLRHVPTDDAYRLDVTALEQAIEDDLGAGRLPTCVVATVGTTSSGAVDSVASIGALCEKHGIWLHVDGAWAGSAAICPEHRDLFDGVETADSVLFNPHKWLLTNFDCTAYYVKDVDLLLGTHATTPEYLRTAADPDVVNYRDWHIQLGRRFRALKLWFVIRSYGVEGLQAHLRRHIANAAAFAGWVEATPNFELLAPVSLGLVCFRHRPALLPADGAEIDAWNKALLERINAGGDVHLTHTRLGGRYVIRLSVGQRMTERRHVEAVWQRIRDEAG